MGYYRAKRVDANQLDVTTALKSAGVKVLDLSKVAGGCPDLLAFNGEELVFLEVKDGAKSPSRRGLTPDQVRFHKEWPVTVVTSPAEALFAMGVAGIVGRSTPLE